MLLTYKNIRSYPFLGLLILIILTIQGCSYPHPSPYLLANPIVMAYRHTLNLDSLQLYESKDSFGILDYIDEGFVINTPSLEGGGPMYSIWINDSLLVLKVNSFAADFFEHIDKISSKVRFEAKLRKQRPLLVNQVLQDLSNSGGYFGNPNAIRENEMRHLSFRAEVIPFEITADSVTVVDQLHWQSTAFGDSMSIHFKKGIMDGETKIRDTTKLTVKEGFYRQGFEEGTWKAFDLSNNQLQWTEDWTHGELHKVAYEPGAFIDRAEPLPTFRHTVILHRCVFYGFLLLGLLILVFYIRSFRNFSFPYGNDSIWIIIGKFILSPFLAAGTIALFIFFWMILMTILKGGFGWDIPGDFTRPLLLFVFYFFGGSLYFLATFRTQDTLWHAGLLSILYILLEEYDFLKSLEVGVF